MGFKFRKRVKILPGVSVNLTENGVSSVSVGTTGAKVNLRKNKPPRLTTSLRGTGISYTQDLGSSPAQPKNRPATPWGKVFLWLFGLLALLVGLIKR